MRKNIGSYLDKLREYLLTQTSIFSEIIVWKPVNEIEGLSLYFALTNNSVQISNDVRWIERKKALFDFFISWENKSTPEVEIYEAIDSFVNSVMTDKTENIDIWGLTIHSIEEGSQSGILRDSKDRPFVILQVYISYTYRY